MEAESPPSTSYAVAEAACARDAFFFGITPGGQTFNSGTADLNLLCAFFLEQSRDNPAAVKRLIDQNAKARGWLIFATHDVCASPS